MSEAGFLLKAQNLHKNYTSGNKRLQVLKGIDLAVKSAESLSIVGPSGAGKSTLLHILGGLDQPDDGKVFFEGRELSRIGDEEISQIRNQAFGFVFQFYHLLPEFSALENVILPAVVAKQNLAKSTLRDRGLELLKAVGLHSRTSHRPAQLSGGEQQRLAIARAIVNSPKILFCDEPTGNLDSNTGEEIIDLLMELNEVKKMTILIVTHDEHLAKRAERLIHIHDGKIVD